MAANRMIDPPAPSPPVVLVVDDEPEVVSVVLGALRSASLTAVGAASAAEALAILRATPGIAVVLTDVRMAGTDGIALLAEVLALRDDRLATEVVVMSGHGSVETVARAMRGGAVDFLAKPFVLGELRDVVSRALARATERRTRARTDGAQTGGALARHERTVVHEVRTALIPVLGFAEILALGVTDEETVRRFGAEIVAGARRTLASFNRCLALLRLEADDAAPQREEFDADAFVRELLATGDPGPRAAEAVDVGFPAGLRLHADRKLLLLAGRALLDNAAEAGPPGTRPRLELAAGAGVQRLRVTDQGPAFPPEQGGAGGPNPGRGDTTGRLGLGTALARVVAARLGGSLRLGAAPEGGAAATLEWPAG